jgi:DNA-binding NarL/FixJ family response regulator
MHITVSIDDPLVRDLVAVRGRTLGLISEATAEGVSISDGETHERDQTVTVVIVAAVDAEALEQCGRERVIGVLTHASPPELLDLALTWPTVEGLVVDPYVAGRLARRVARTEPLGASSGLTEREHEILRLMATGMPMKQIAAQLGITAKTVENHATKMYAKLGVRNRREAVAQAVSGVLG